jgi:hypothetical protein
MPDRLARPEVSELAQPASQAIGFADVHEVSALDPPALEQFHGDRRVPPFEPPAGVRPQEDWGCLRLPQHDVDPRSVGHLRDPSIS